MIRIGSFCILLGTIWLASMAIPLAGDHGYLSRSVDVALQSNPQVRTANKTYAQYGRLPADIFGTRKTDDSFDTDASFSTASTVVKHVPLLEADRGGIVASNAFKQVPLPTSKLEIAPFIVADTKPVSAPEPQWIPTFETLVIPVKAKATSETSVAQRAEPAITLPPVPRLSSSESRRVARGIQQELQRVGCYTGTIDGIWGTKSRLAMQAFAQALSAPIPTEQPGYVALMLVETYDARACAASPSPSRTILVDARQRPSTQTDTTQVASITQLNNRTQISKFTSGRTGLGGPTLEEDWSAQEHALPVRKSSRGNVAAWQNKSSRIELADADPTVDQAATETQRRATQVRNTRLKDLRRAAIRSAQVRKRKSIRQARLRQKRAKRARRTTYGFSSRGRRRHWVRQAFTSRN